MVDEKSFTFACPHCGQHFEADYDMVGMALDCPKCGQAFIVPAIRSVPNGDGIPRECCGVPATKELPSEGETINHTTHPVIPVIKRRTRFLDGSKKWLKLVGIGVAVLLLFIGVGVLILNNKGKDTTDDTALTNGKENETAEDVAITNESLIDRLRRLKFDVKVINEEGGLAVSDTGVDEPVFMVEERRTTTSSRSECVVVCKSFGPWFVRDRETIYKMKERDGWNARFEDSRYTFLYKVRIKKGVSDKKLISTIRDVQRQNLPFQIDAEYQTRWSILTALRCLRQYDSGNNPNDRWLHSMSVNLQACPDDFQKAMKDLIMAIPRQTEDMVTAGGNLGMLIGSMNEDNPRGGALLGGLLGAIVGAARQEEAAKEQERVLKAKSDDLLNIARKYGADPNDLNDVPYGWDK